MRVLGKKKEAKNSPYILDDVVETMTASIASESVLIAEDRGKCMELQTSIHKLLRRLGVFEDETIVIHETESLSARDIKITLSTLQNEILEGTLCVIADCEFNTDSALKEGLESLSNQERMVLASGKFLQLLTLQPQCLYVNHPSLMIGSTGKYSHYFARHTHVDFPYGNPSIFQDFYELDAVLLWVGKPDLRTELMFALSKVKQAVIRKNTMMFDQVIASYLDYDDTLLTDFDFESLESLFLYEKYQDTAIYGIRYQELLRAILLQFT